MPRPPTSGCYSVRRPSGQGFLLQWSAGRLVELIGPVELASPPKRTATRYLGPSITEVVREQQERRRLAMIEALAMHAWRDL